MKYLTAAALSAFLIIFTSCDPPGHKPAQAVDQAGEATPASAASGATPTGK